MEFIQHCLDVYNGVWAGMGFFTKLTIGAAATGVATYLVYHFIDEHDRKEKPVGHFFMAFVCAVIAIGLLSFAVPFIPYALFISVVAVSGWSACMIVHLLVKLIKKLFRLTEKQ